MQSGDKICTATYSFNLKLEALCSSEMLATKYQLTWYTILKSYSFMKYLLVLTDVSVHTLQTVHILFLPNPVPSLEKQESYLVIYVVLKTQFQPPPICRKR